MDPLLFLLPVPLVQSRPYYSATTYYDVPVTFPSLPLVAF